MDCIHGMGTYDCTTLLAAPQQDPWTGNYLPYSWQNLLLPLLIWYIYYRPIGATCKIMVFSFIICSQLSYEVKKKGEVLEYRQKA